MYSAWCKTESVQPSALPNAVCSWTGSAAGRNRVQVALSSSQADFSCFSREHYLVLPRLLPGSEAASSKVWVLLGHAAAYHAIILSRILGDVVRSLL